MPMTLLKEKSTPTARVDIDAFFRKLGLRHAVITSVNRDELSDGGAHQFVDTIHWTRKLNPI